MARTYDPFGAELRRFVDNMDKRQFRALSHGLGFAEVRKKNEPQLSTVAPLPRFHQRQSFSERIERPIPPPKLWPEKPVEQAVVSPAPMNPMPFIVAAPEVLPRRRNNSGILRKIIRVIFAHIIDLFVVHLSLCIAAITAAFFFAPVHSQGVVATLSHWAPIALILNLNIISFFLLSYALFGLYWGLLRFAAGTTVGHSLIPNTRPSLK
jgi:hypothetical protein